MELPTNPMAMIRVFKKDGAWMDLQLVNGTWWTTNGSGRIWTRSEIRDAQKWILLKKGNRK